MHKKHKRLTSRKSDKYYVKKISSAALEMVPYILESNPL